MRKTLPAETFYPGLSLNYDLGYGSEGEYNIIRNILQSEGLLTDDRTVSKALEISKSAYDFLRKHCQSEVEQYEQESKKEFIVGCDILPIVALAHALVGIAVGAVKLKKSFSSVVKEKLPEDTMLEAITKKLESTEEGKIIAKKTTEFEISLDRTSKKKLKKNTKKPKKSGRS